MANILYIDDIIEKLPLVGKDFSRIVASLGYTPFTAVDGDEGLKIVKSNPDIGLIFLDWNMPNLNGYDVLRNLHSGNHHIPVVIASFLVSCRQVELERGVVATGYQHVIGYISDIPARQDIERFLAQAH